MIPFFSRRRKERELDEEIRAHLRMAVEERVARGESREEAERAAWREFGDEIRVKEVTRMMWGGMWLDTLARDVRAAFRGLGRSPGFAMVVVLTIALGVGANTAVFTVVESILLRPLPFGDPGRLYLVSYDVASPSFDRPPSMWDETYGEFRLQNRSFEGVASFGQREMTLTGAGDPTRLPSAFVTAGFTSVMGVRPALGRGFVSDEETPGRDHVVLLSDEVWRTRFGADTGIVGQPVILDGEPYTVVGVMPPRFHFPYDVRLWVPVARGVVRGGSYILPVIGRLRPGVSREAATAELSGIGRSVSLPNVVRDANPVASVLPLTDFIAGDVKQSLLVLLGAVGFVLLIACANVANLLLARAAGRRSEMAVRAALGAGRARIVRQLLTESAVLALVGGTAGVLLSFIGVRALLSATPAGSIPRLDEIHVDGVVLFASLAVTLLSGLAFGVVPALVLSRETWSAIGDGGHTLGGHFGRLRRSLVVGELALSIVLLAGGGLLLRSFAHMRAVDPGFRSDHVVAMTLDLPEAQYPDIQALRAFQSALVDRLSSIPELDAVGAVSDAPLTSSMLAGTLVTTYRIEGVDRLSPGSSIDETAATPGYFGALGIDLLYGRTFTDRDDADAPGIAIVSRSVARRFWPPDGAEAIGQHMSGLRRPGDDAWLTIVGVVDDVAQTGLTASRRPTMYTPVAQTSATFLLNHTTYMVRTPRDPSDVMSALRRAVVEQDPNLAVSDLRTMDDLVSETLSQPRFQATLLSVFSAIALLLAAIGTYGVLAFDVASRTHEIGLRMALGAERRAVESMILRRAAATALIGVVLGLGGASALTRFLRESLFEITPNDPGTLLSVSAILFSAALMAAAVPAWRASHVDPLVALKHD